MAMGGNANGRHKLVKTTSGTLTQPGVSTAISTPTNASATSGRQMVGASRKFSDSHSEVTKGSSESPVKFVISPSNRTPKGIGRPITPETDTSDSDDSKDCEVIEVTEDEDSDSQPDVVASPEK